MHEPEAAINKTDSLFRKIVSADGTSDDEQAFRAFYQAKTLRVAQAGGLVAIVLILAVCVLDWLVMPPEFAWPAIIFRASTMLVLLLGAIAFSVLRPSDPLVPYAFMATGALNGIGTVIVGGIAARSGIEFVLWGTIYATFFVYLVFGLRFRLATVAGWPLLITFFTIGVLVDKPFVKLAYGSLFLVFTNIIGMYASYRLERDARELFDKEKELEHLARTDGLTGVSNRRSFDEHLESIWSQARREGHAVAVLLVDIDHFKLFNDCYGHGPGDKCIQTVADALDRSVHRPLDQVSRYGGEEFAVALYDPTDEYVRDYAEQVVEMVAALDIEHKASDVADHVTVSVGAAVMKPDATKLSEILVRSADDALYEAKAKGRNGAAVFYLDPNLHATRTLKSIAI